MSMPLLIRPRQGSHREVTTTGTLPLLLEHMCEFGDSLPGMSSLPHSSGPDAPLRYRIDRTGTTVAILPATCRSGLHALTSHQTRVVMQEGEVRISCPACAANGSESCWRLSTSKPAPERAEMSEEFYLDLMLHHL
jgi:hypothetical protein